MNIAYIVPSLANKGPIIIVKQLAGIFVQHGHQCEVFYFDDIIELSFDCPVRRISKKDVIDFSRYDVVHSHGIRPDLYIFKNKQRKEINSLFVSTLHNYVFEDLRYEYNIIIAELFGRLWIHWLKRHNIIIASCKDSLRYYSKWIPIERLTYAYNTRYLDRTKEISSDDLEDIKRFKAGSILIGANSLLTDRKGIDILLNAMPALIGYKLLVVGDGKSRNSLEILAKRLKIESRCLFIGYKQDAYRYLAEYDIFAIPSRSEGFPLALLEAAAYTVPTVASDIPVMQEAFSSDEVSFFELKNPKSIIPAIINATSNHSMAHKMNQKYISLYSPDSQYNQYLNIYKNKF